VSSGSDGFGVTGSGAYSASLASSASGTTGFPGAPLNVLTRNIGDGSLEITWDDPASGQWSHFDIYLCETPNGAYQKVNRSNVTGNRYVAKNLPYGHTIYCRMRAVNGDMTSDWSNRGRDATCGVGRGRVLFTGQVGDQIPINTVFTARVGDQLVGLKTVQGGTLA
jgi:hypothetical protein